MDLALNEKQAEKLADLCFNLTNGLLLGSFRLILIRQIELAVFYVVMATGISVALVKFGLHLLR